MQFPAAQSEIFKMLLLSDEQIDLIYFNLI